MLLLHCHDFSNMNLLKGSPFSVVSAEGCYCSPNTLLLFETQVCFLCVYFSKIIIIPHTQRSWGGYIGFTPPSVCLSVSPASCVCSVTPAVLVGTISYLYIFFFFFFFIANTKIKKTIQIQHTQQRFDTMPTNKDLLHVQPNVCASNLLRQTTQYHIDVTLILPYSFHFNCDYPCEIHVIAFHTWRVISSHDDHHTYIC